MRKYLILFILLFSTVLLIAQPVFFEKSFGDTILSEKGIGVVEAPDGMLYFSGITESGQSGNSQVQLHKITPDGTILWIVTHNAPTEDFVNSMILHQNQLLVAGETHDSTGNIDAFVMQFDTNGTHINTLKHGVDNQTETYASISPTNDGGWVCAGFVTGQVGIGNDFYVVKYNSNGVEEWANAYGGNQNETAYKAIQLPNGEYAVAGDEAQNGGNYNVLLKGLDAQGNEIWSKTAREPQNGGSKNMIRTHDNHLLVVGEMNQPGFVSFDTYLVKSTTDGVVIWTKFVNGTPDAEAGFGIHEVNSNSYVITGYAKNPATQNQDLMLLSVDSLGNEIDIQYYGDVGPEVGYTVIPSQNGGFICSGFTTINGNNQNYLIYDDIQLTVNTVELEKASLSIFPNPLVQNTIYLNQPLWDGQLNIFDNKGQLIESQQLNGAEYRIDSHLISGIYFIQVQQKLFQKTFKVIIQ